MPHPLPKLLPYLEAHFKKYPRMNPIQEALDDLKAWDKADERAIAVHLSLGYCDLKIFRSMEPKQ